MKKLILFIFVLFLISPVLAQEELLLQINLFEDGSALIIGSATINPEIEDIKYEEGALYGYTQHLTNKKGITWTFSLELEQEFSNNYIKILLPENAKLGLVSSDLESFVSIEGGSIVIEFVGKEKVDIEFYYEIETQQEKEIDFIYIIVIIVIIIILIISIWSFLRRIKKNGKREKEEKIKSKRKNKKKSKENPLKPVMNTLNEREKKIINELLEHKKLKQNQLQHLTKIPKVSLSRHLVNLENKNLIVKKSLGKTNLIQINKDFNKKQEDK